VDYRKYTNQQLNELLPPKKVAFEFGLTTDTLAYLREVSLDTGKLRGPLFFKDENIILYKRENIINYIQDHTFGTETTKTTKRNKPADIVPIKENSQN
jgi:hypothetical protein